MHHPSSLYLHFYIIVLILIYTGTSPWSLGREIVTLHSVQVLLKFHNMFHRDVWMLGMTFDVRFSIKRSSFVFMHEAIQLSAEARVDLATVMPSLGLLGGLQATRECGIV